MYSLIEGRKYFVYPYLVDIRKSHDRLAGLIRNELNRDPKNGDVVIFFNKNKNQAKLFFWDYNGYAIYYKRLETDRFYVPPGRSDDQGYYISEADVLTIIIGIRMKNLTRKKDTIMKKKVVKTLPLYTTNYIAS